MINKCVYTYIYIYILCMYVCVCIYIYIYTYTHIDMDGGPRGRHGGRLLDPRRGEGVRGARRLLFLRLQGK